HRADNRDHLQPTHLDGEPVNTTTPTGSCLCCRKRDPQPGEGLVCGPCRRWLPIALDSIPELVDRAREELIPADDSHSHPVLVCTTCALTVPYTRDHRYAYHEGHPETDRPASGRCHAGWVQRSLVRRAAGPAKSIAPDVVVTGSSGEPPVPLDLHLYDLLAPVVRDGGRPVDVTGDNWVPALDTRPR